jgi:hypothetical protein
MRTLKTSMVNSIATTVASNAGEVTCNMAVAKRINYYSANMLDSFHSQIVSTHNEGIETCRVDTKDKLYSSCLISNDMRRCRRMEYKFGYTHGNNRFVNAPAPF